MSILRSDGGSGSNQHGKDCPYCGTPFVLADKQIAAIRPDGVVPFQIDKNKVGDCFRKWMKGRWLAPGELKHLYQQDKLQGIYIPYWTFDADADVNYLRRRRTGPTGNAKGQGRKDYTEVVTDWYPVAGHVNSFF